jgi:hypothetical protein
MEVSVWSLSRPSQIDSWKHDVFSISLLLRTASKRLQAQITSAISELGRKPHGFRWASLSYRPDQKLSERRHERATPRTEIPHCTASHEQTIACPHCLQHLTFSRTNPSFIDACGFETYGLDCPECAVRLEGLIDPRDEALLLSQATL